jgi:hypothetical protein
VGSHNGSKEFPVPFKFASVEQLAYLYEDEDGQVRDKEDGIIESRTVVEFIYDATISDARNEFKWIPLRTRFDKTESVNKYKKSYGNEKSVAANIFKTIINPITIDTFTLLGTPMTFNIEYNRLNTLINEPESTLNKSLQDTSRSNAYYQKRTDLGTSMRAFHNFIKKNIIGIYCKGKDRVLDMACGRGGDINKIIMADVKQYVGIDVDYAGLFQVDDSALNRYNKIKRNNQDITDMVFIHADGRALFESAVQNNMIKNMSTENKINIEKYLSPKAKYDVINCQFAIHYMAGSEVTWNNFCENINNLIADDGYLLITTFDGRIVNNKLMENAEKNKWAVAYTNNNGTSQPFFEIQKLYNDSITNFNTPGISIDLYNAMISTPGTYITEYLVTPTFLIDSMYDKCKMELIETDTFSNLFELYHNLFMSNKSQNIWASDLGQKQFESIRDYYLSVNGVDRTDSDLSALFDKFSNEEIEINKASYEFSCLNRYYVFKRKEKNLVLKPARVVNPIKQELNLGQVLTPFFNSKNLKLAIELKRQKINDSYHGAKKLYNFDSPDVYLIRHQINNINGIEIDSYNLLKIEKSKSKDLSKDLNKDLNKGSSQEFNKDGRSVDIESDTNQSPPTNVEGAMDTTNGSADDQVKPYLFFYKSPDGYFYPIYIKDSSSKRGKHTVVLTDKTLRNEINYLIKYNESAYKK